MTTAFDYSYTPGGHQATLPVPVLPAEPEQPSRRYTQMLFSPVSPLFALKARLDDWRLSRGYSADDYPGIPEDLLRHLKALHATNYVFDGAKADLQKTVSLNPLFQVSHAFTTGSTLAGPSASAGTYNFSAVHATDSTLVTGAIDGDGSLQGRANYGWRPQSSEAISKLQFQLASGSLASSMFVWQQDFNGPGYSTMVRLSNPSITESSGSMSLGSMINVTRKFALGVQLEAARQSMGRNMLATSVNMLGTAKYSGLDWTALAQVMPGATATFGFIKKLNERVEAGAELVLLPSPNPKMRQATATLGVKYEYRPATFRGSIDSTGKVSAYLEQRLNPIMSFLMSGELDHAKNTSRFGIGFQLDSATIDEQTAANAVQIKPPT